MPRRLHDPLLLAGVIGLGVLFLALDGDLSAAAVAIWTALAQGFPVALLWMAAFGFGAPIARAVFPATRAAGSAATPDPTPADPPAARLAAVRWAATLGAGMAVLMTGLHLVGWAGWFSRPVILVFLLLGIAGAARAAPLRAWVDAVRIGGGCRHPALALAAVPIVLLALAASLPPGLLWPAEAHGYDVLEYHLQVPREWVEARGIAPLPHNTYSYLPLNLEVLYAALMSMLGGPYEGMLAAQWLHASFAVVTAALLGRWITARTTSVTAGWWTALGLLLTPAVLIVGSLAYNEMAVLFLLACAWMVAAESGGTLAAGLAGAVSGTALGTKLTAIGFVVAPVAVAAVLPLAADAGFLRDREGGADPPLTRRPMQRAWRLAAFLLAAVAAFSPYLVRNAAWTGNPLFPMASRVLGRAHWSGESETRWVDAHAPRGTWTTRVASLWTQGIGHDFYHPLAWLLALAGAALCGMRGRQRALAAQAMMMLLLQMIFWSGYTHTAARFLLPVAIPLAVAIGLGWAAAVGSAVRFGPAAVAGALLLAWSLHAASGLISRFREAAAAFPPFVAADFLIAPELLRKARVPDGLPPGRILLVGEARAFHFPASTLYVTPFERSVLAELWVEEAGNAPAVLAQLRRRGISVLLVAWSEVDRLRETYGLDPELNRETLAALTAAGLSPIAELSTPQAAWYRVPNR